MNFNSFIATINSVADNKELYLKYEKNLDKELRASARKAGTVLTKITETIVVKGIEYSKQKQIEEAVADGYQLTHQLPWGEWDATYKNIINHKGNRYARLYYPTCKNDSDEKHHAENIGGTRYFLNGNEVSKQYLKDNDLMIPSFWNKDTPNALTINVENIMEIA